MEAAIANIQFNNIEGEIHVYASLDGNPEIIGFGPMTLADVISRIPEDNHFEIKSVFRDMLSNSLPGYMIRFEIDEDCGQIGVLDLKAMIGTNEFDLGNYFIFAEGNGVTGLRSWVAIRERHASDTCGFKACPS
ncbi:hypothetical protein [Rhizobium rhizogenes]|uniref:hypothetical protein n=1 Tax=Rhizobium rhizogenes TaxID=359 RepID=UPI0015716D54|nr:hypothetical protein [Rhizobium rhizogenes]NTF49109.1 hypothetical protein [Rhizobium rhizogenes]NTH06493.1 hypothetical protein [Rhizobium rhizogenes]